ncbi:DUF1707 SHOCT-like domain-containing protein [Amycolatopsis samaneae]|uniref:DUF1707 domain-containing protein n=1 Tax=Amycolatopsis samaneae TaxID=664691 RepID=A0ABW5GBR3_9PSEU
MGEGQELVRASETDRERALDRLTHAVGEGTLRLDEVGGRFDRVLAAGTRGELAEVLADLPAAPSRSEPPALVLHTTNGHVRQTGPWVVPREIVARCGVGRIRIDLTEATCPYSEVVLRAKLDTVGCITVVVPHGWAVRVEQVEATRGRVINRITAPARDDAPLLRVLADVGSGRLKLKH